MKYILTFLLLAFTYANAELHIVEVSNFTYTPTEITVHPGDTIRFQWIEGTHPTESDDSKWEKFPMDESNKVHDLVIEEPGNYPYFCTFHGARGGVGMSGTIIVDQLQSVEDNAISSIYLYPNPASDFVSVISENPDHTISSLIDINGNVVSTMNYKVYSDGLIDVSELPTGIYFIVSELGDDRLVKSFIKN